MYHCIKEEEFRQEFLGKSSYKFNSRYIGYRVLDRITVAATFYKPTFKHQLWWTIIPSKCVFFM